MSDKQASSPPPPPPPPLPVVVAKSDYARVRPDTPALTGKGGSSSTTTGKQKGTR